MLSVNYSEVPSYLRSSELFKAMAWNGTSSLMVPSDCFKQNATIQSVEEFAHFLKTASFWILDIPHRDLLDFVLRSGFGSHSTDSETWRLFCSYKFAADFVVLRDTMPCDRITVAVNSAMPIVIVKHLHELGHALPLDATFLAAQCGCKDLLQYFHAHGCALTNEGACRAARNGELEVLEYFHIHHFQFDTTVGENAAFDGHLSCLQYVHEATSNMDLSACVCQACIGGHLECVKYLRRQGGEITSYAATLAARHRHFNCVQFAVMHGTPVTSEMALEVCKTGNLWCLAVLMERHCEVHFCAFVAAAFGYHEPFVNIDDYFRPVRIALFFIFIVELILVVLCCLILVALTVLLPIVKLSRWVLSHY